MRIFVGNLSHGASDNRVRGLFIRFGTVGSVKLIRDHASKSRGFAYVDMPDEKEAQNAIRELNGSESNGRTIRVCRVEQR